MTENNDSQDKPNDLIHQDKEIVTSTVNDHQNTPPKKLKITQLAQQLTTQKVSTETHKTNYRTKLNNINSQTTELKIKTMQIDIPELNIKVNSNTHTLNLKQITHKTDKTQSKKRKQRYKQIQRSNNKQRRDPKS